MALLSGFTRTMLQNFYAYDLIPVWVFKPAIFSELPVPASLSKGSYSEVLLALLLETRPGAGFWPSAPLKKATVPAGKTQGGVFPPRFWLFSRRFSVCEVSFLFPLKKKKKKDYNTAMIWTSLGCVPWGGSGGCFS